MMRVPLIQGLPWQTLGLTEMRFCQSEPLARDCLLAIAFSFDLVIRYGLESVFYQSRRIWYNPRVEPFALASEGELMDKPSSDDDWYEVIEGKRVELPPMSILSAWIASQLHGYIGIFCKAHQLGRTLSHGLFHLPTRAKDDRRPKVAFVSYQRWAKNRPLPRFDDAWDVVPDLAVEVVSPTDAAEALLEKVDEYFRAGVRLIWVVFPLHSLVHVIESPTQIRVLTAADELDGGAVVPGFRLALAELFAETGEHEEAMS